jgi:hypothetical protein
MQPGPVAAFAGHAVATELSQMLVAGAAVHVPTLVRTPAAAPEAPAAQVVDNVAPVEMKPGEHTGVHGGPPTTCVALQPLPATALAGHALALLAAELSHTLALRVHVPTFVRIPAVAPAAGFVPQ